jgi:hypothetical protein
VGRRERPWRRRPVDGSSCDGIECGRQCKSALGRQNPYLR